MSDVQLRSDSRERQSSCQGLPWRVILRHTSIDRGPAIQGFDAVDPAIFTAAIHDSKAVFLSLGGA